MGHESGSYHWNGRVRHGSRGHSMMADLEAISGLTWNITGCFQKLASPNLSRMVKDCLVEEAAQQKQVLEMLSDLDF